MGDIAREESFRTSLRNQRRRLSATEKKPNGEPLGSSLLGSKGNNPLYRESLTPPRKGLGGAGVAVAASESASSTPLTNNSKQSTPDIKLEFWDIDELSPLSTPAVSRSPSPYELHDLQLSRSPSPRNIRSPLPPNSPL